MSGEHIKDDLAINFKELFKVLKKRQKLIVTIFLVVVLSVAVVSYLIPPTYEAETTLRIKQPRGLSSSLLMDMPSNVRGTKQLMSTYVEILKSRTVLEKVISITEKKIDNNNKKLTKDGLLSKITTIPVRDTEILKIKVRAKSPTEAQIYANTLVNAFIDRITYLSRSEQSQVRQFIGGRLQEAREELTRAEAALENYKRDQKIVAPQEETKVMVEQFASINKLAAENSVALASAEAKLINARKQLEQENTGYVAENLMIQQYKSKLAELEVKLVGLLQKYTANHPEVLGIRAEVVETKKKLKEEIARVVNYEAPSLNPIHQNLLQTLISAQAEIDAAKSQKKAIDRILLAKEQDLIKLPTKERGLAKVTRDAMVAQEIYIMLAKRYEESQISEVMQPTDVQRIDVAVAPQRDKPIAPRKKQNIIIAAIFGIFLGVTLSLILEYVNKTIVNAEEAQEYLNIPILGNIPKFESESEVKKGWPVFNFLKKTG